MNINLMSFLNKGTWGGGGTFVAVNTSWNTQLYDPYRFSECFIIYSIKNNNVEYP